MTPEQKIATILKNIKDEAAINPDPKWMKFEFNYHVVGAGILSEDEERRILFKLEKEGAVNLHLSMLEADRPREVTVLSSEEGKEFIESRYYWVEILRGFEEKYNQYMPYLEDEGAVKKKTEGEKQNHVAVKMTESARNNVFINSQIHGGVEIAGQGNSFIKTRIKTLKEEHSFWFWFTVIGTLISVITGLMFLAQFFGLLPPGLLR